MVSFKFTIFSSGVDVAMGDDMLESFEGENETGVVDALDDMVELAVVKLGGGEGMIQLLDISGTGKFDGVGVGNCPVDVTVLEKWILSFGIELHWGLVLVSAGAVEFSTVFEFFDDSFSSEGLT